MHALYAQIHRACCVEVLHGRHAWTSVELCCCYERCCVLQLVACAWAHVRAIEYSSVLGNAGVLTAVGQTVVMWRCAAVELLQLCSRHLALARRRRSCIICITPEWVCPSAIDELPCRVRWSPVRQCTQLLSVAERLVASGQVRSHVWLKPGSVGVEYGKFQSGQNCE